MAFDAHGQVFVFFGEGGQLGNYDNMKMAVDAILIGRERRYNRCFEQMCRHYLVQPVVCTPVSGREVEGQIRRALREARESDRPALIAYRSALAQVSDDHCKTAAGQGVGRAWLCRNADQ